MKSSTRAIWTLLSAAALAGCRSIPKSAAGPGPLAVSARAVAYDRVLVHWEEPPAGGAAQYAVYRDGVEVGRTAEREFLDRNVPAASSLPRRYEVAAVRDGVAGERSEPVESARRCPREGIPEPILGEHPEWVELYWKAWQVAWEGLREPAAASGLVSPYLVSRTGADRPACVDLWETCFAVLLSRYAGGVFPSIRMLDNFYAKQHADGFIPGELRADAAGDAVPGDAGEPVHPPLLAWIEWESYRFTGDADRLKAVLPRLVKHFHWMQEHRRRPNGFYWTNDATGGAAGSARAEAHSLIDATAQQALAALNISRIAEAVEDRSTAETFRAEHRLLAELINRKAWDPDEQFYFDLDASGAFLPAKTAASFWPLLAQIPSLTQAAGLVYHLNSPREFRRPHAFPSLSADHPSYDAGGALGLGAVEPPSWLATVKGLEAYGIYDLAFEATMNHLASVAEVHRRAGAFFDSYAPESAGPAAGAERDPAALAGLGPVAGLIDTVIGVQVSAARDLVHWRLRLTEEHGVRGLRFGRHEVSLRCEKRAQDAPCRITVETAKPLTLVVDPGFGPHLVSIPAGGASFTLRSPAIPEG